MSILGTPRSLAAHVMAALAASPLLAQTCPVIDFENLAAGTAVTNQYAASHGVTFSLVGTGCPVATPAFCRIISAGAGTSSPTRALGRDQSCPDFYSGDFVITFSSPHDEVHFNLGNWGGGTYTVEAFDAAGGGAVNLVDTTTVGLMGDAATPVYYPIVVSAPGIRRIEISHSVGGAEVAIDDLGWDPDTTAPTAAFTSPPAEGGCVCNLVPIIGTALDTDGTGVRWSLHRRGVGAGAWTSIATSSTPVDNAQLVVWNTTALEGYYTWRLTVTNDCGLVSTATWLVYLERELAAPTIRYPGAGATVGGIVCVDGTVWDKCPRSPDTYTVEFAPLPAGVPYVRVDPLFAAYDGTVVNDPYALWNTRIGGAAVADGNYRIRVTGYDECGDAGIATQDVVIDNTPPMGIITAPEACAGVGGVVAVRGTVSDAHLDRWTLQYSRGGGDADWVTLNSGVANVGPNGLLHNWDTTLLDPCDYVLRLIVTDTSSLNCGASNHRVEYTLAVSVGCPGDFNQSGAVTVQDVFDFLTAYFAGCP
ncbi:MAG: hypothetical protein IT438_02410 [Phycisphaerales bacterium]|nr:hypothetical protein [Phycisphaerales bacterium]